MQSKDVIKRVDASGISQNRKMNDKMSALKREIEKMLVSDIKQLDIWLQDLIQQRLNQSVRIRLAIDERNHGGKTYRLEQVRCGRDNCKCTAGGTLHGPYWYAYWSENGKTRTRYIGKELKML